MNGIRALIKETVEGSLSLLPCVDREISPGILVWDFPASTAHKNKYVLFIIHLVYGTNTFLNSHINSALQT